MGMMRFDLLITEDTVWFEDNADYRVVASVHVVASDRRAAWKRAAKFFRFSQPKVMALFGSGKVAIVSPKQGETFSEMKRLLSMVTTLQVIFASGRRRIFSRWSEMYSAFDRTPMDQLAGALITESFDNCPVVTKYRLDFGPCAYSNGYPMLRVK